MLARGAFSLDFTDGDTFKRVSFPDTNLRSFDEVFCQIRRPFISEADDPGWSYVPNIVSVSDGAFVVNVAALMMGEPPINNEAPNETVTLAYFVPG